MSRLLLVFVDEPLPGRVQEGLAKSLGAENAARIHRALVRVLLRQLSGLTDCRIRFCFTPDDGHDGIKFWILPEIIDRDDILLDPSLAEFHPQGDGDHGDRLRRAFAAAFTDGYEKVAAIGVNCIEVSSRWIHAAFAQLNARHDAAIGATHRGDYHLLALQREHSALFQNTRWSSPETFRTAVARAEEEGISLYQLPPLPSVDRKSDYEAALDGPLGPALRKAMKELGDG